MNVHPNAAFRQIVAMTLPSMIAEAEAALSRAVMLGQPVDDLRARHARLEAVSGALTYPADDSSEAAAIAALTPQWPADLLGALPEWFTDPAAAALADPPGADLVVACSESPEEQAARIAASQPEQGPRDMVDGDT